MLNEGDIELMSAWQDEIYTHRERPIDVIYYEELRDEFTGEVLDEITVTREVSAVVTEISSAADRYMENGIKYEQGDIWLSVKIELIADIADDIERIKHDGKDYEILAMDKKGIGRRNRYEILGRLIA